VSAHLLYDSVSFSRISEAFLVEFSMADILDACSLQLFSWMALYSDCTTPREQSQSPALKINITANIGHRNAMLCTINGSSSRFS
jgi:hypothetical protein